TRVSCTYAKCGKQFPSKRDMDIHKITEHEYCERCDEDFPDEERLLIHKIISVKHIVCPVCGLEFRSSGGRDVHIRQNHRAEQTIDCRGCTMSFKSASALMQHIESNGCRRIPRARLLQQQETRLMIAEILDGDRPIRPEDLDNDDGGVMLNGTPLKSPVSPRRSPRNKTPDAKSPTSANPSPSAGTSVMNSPCPLHQQQQQSIPSSPSNKTEKSMATAILFGKPVASAGEILREITPGWDSSKFLNMCRTRYVCHCRVSYKRVEDFETHVIEEMRDRKPLGCPRCFRNFKRSSDLVAHMETGSNRCSVASGSAYHQVLDQLTGGVVRVAGTLQDGTINYEAGNVEPLYEPDNETTLAGIDTSYTFRSPVW
ncbi:putative C2H2 finger domain protein, partial [Aspergillus aculeatinus CBS 121060]